MKHARSALALAAALLCLAAMLAGCAQLRRLLAPADPTEPPIPGNQTDPKQFVRNEDGSIDYPGALQGIDVSSHQQEIDWQKVRGAGISFAILRVGFRGYAESGTLNLDERFAENYDGAKAAGLQVGVYFYSQATSVAEAEAEAAFVLEALDGRALDLPVFYDWEEVSRGRTGGYATMRVSDFAAAFCGAVREAGYRSGVYFSQSYGYRIMRLENLLDSAFWLAEYNSYQSFDYAVGFWQYTGKGRVDGISLPVDRDIMYMQAEQRPEDGT